MLSLLMSCRTAPDTQTIQLELTNVDTGASVACSDASFLLRVTIDTNMSIVRCLLRHIASGDEVHIQSSLNILAFMQAHLLRVQPDDDEHVFLEQKAPSDTQGNDL